MSEKILLEKIESLENKVDNLSDQIIELKNIISEMTKTTCRMDDHISFVEATYDTLKKPLDFFKSKVNYLTN